MSATPRYDLDRLRTSRVERRLEAGPIDWEGWGVVDKLPPGRNRLTHEEVVRDQRRRIGRSLGECLAEKGYARTTVGDIITRAHVSRGTFYELYDDKQACLLDVYSRARGRLTMTALATESDEAPIDRLRKVVRYYIDVMTEDPAIARVFLVEIYAAGPAAVRERLKLQQGTADRLAASFGFTTDDERFACRAVVAVIATTITQELVLGSATSARALYEPLVALATRMLQPSAMPSRPDATSRSRPGRAATKSVKRS